MKKIFPIFFLLIAGCTKPELPTPEIVANSNIFSVSQSTVTNGQLIYFDLPSPGIYTLTLIDKETNQVISREKFTGQIGENARIIYTNSLKPKEMNLLLENFEKKEIGKTVIIKK